MTDIEVVELQDGAMEEEIPTAEILDYIGKARGVEMRPKEIKRKSLTYVRPSSSSTRTSGDFKLLEYDYAEVGRAEDTEAYLYQGVLKKLSLSIKEGYELVGQNPDMVRYIERRFREIEYSQGQTMRSVIVELLGNLFRYHTVFLVKIRSEEASTGFSYKIGGKTMMPVAGYSVIAPTNMEVMVGPKNKPKYWRHKVDHCEDEYIFRDSDVVLITINRKSHFVTAAPPWQPVLEDISALRSIEENAENLVHQHTFPMYYYRVGTKEAPAKIYKDGQTEVQHVERRIQMMPPEGVFVIPERHEIKAVDLKFPRIEGFIDHYKKRVIAGSGLSSIDFGDGQTATRSTADSMSKLGTGNVKFVQQELEDAINSYVIRELLLEGGFGFDPTVKEHEVRLRFNEIDLEAKMAKENHYSLQYTSGIITRSEMRVLAGHLPMTEEQEADTQAEISARIAMKAAQAQAKLTQQNNGSADLSNRTQPENQNGKKSAPGRTTDIEEMSSALERGHLDIFTYLEWASSLEDEEKIDLALWCAGKIGDGRYSDVKDRMSILRRTNNA